MLARKHPALKTMVVAIAILFCMAADGCFLWNPCGHLDPPTENRTGLNLGFILKRPETRILISSRYISSDRVVYKENPSLGDTARMSIYGEEIYHRTHINPFVTIDSQEVRIEFNESDSVVVEKAATKNLHLAFE